MTTENGHPLAPHDAVTPPPAERVAKARRAEARCRAESDAKAADARRRRPRPEGVAERARRENPRDALAAAWLLRPAAPSRETRVHVLTPTRESWPDAREDAAPFEFRPDAYGWPGRPGAGEGRP